MNLTEKSIYPFFETIRVSNGEYQLLDYHQRRMDHVFRYFYRDKKSPDLKEVLKSRLLPLAPIVKCRILFNGGAHTIQFEAYRKRTITRMTICEAEHVLYSFKYTDRTLIEQYSRHFDVNTDSLFVINGRITDSSYGNLILRKGDQWFTPLYPLFYGVQRAYLLEQNEIRTKDILQKDLFKYDELKIINAMMPIEDCISLEVNTKVITPIS